MKKRPLPPRPFPWPRLDPARRSAEVAAFFTRRAPRYDRIADRPYWAFSDVVLRELLLRRVLHDVDPDRPLRFLDAGGGTGRWSLFLLHAFPRAAGVLLDVSPGMLDVAARKAARARCSGRLALLPRDLHEPVSRTLGRFDLVLCFHNVAGLVADPAALVRRLARVLVPGGRIALVLPNLYQAAWVSLRDGRTGELRRLRERAAVKYADSVPEVFAFTPATARRALRLAGCTEVSVLGFPVSVYPMNGAEEPPAPLRGGRTLRSLVRAEVELCLEEEAAARGNCLLAIGTARPRRPRRRT